MVKVSSYSTSIKDASIKKDRLHFEMKCHQAGNISVSIMIDNFKFAHDFFVSFNPCSNMLSYMTIKEIKPLADQFIFRVFVLDVFGEPVPSNSNANCELYAHVCSSENNVISQVQNIEQGEICYDITVKGSRPWCRDLVVRLNGERISHVRDLELTDEEFKAVDALEDEDYDWIKNFFHENDGDLTIPLTTGTDDGKFVTYDEDGCKLQSQSANGCKLVCKNAKKRDILGADFAHVNNIKRIFQLKENIDIQQTADSVTLDIKNLKLHSQPVCKEVVKHLLRGLYYRKKASEAGKIRMQWKNRLISIDEVLWLGKKHPSFVFCKYFKDFFGDLLNRNNRKACDELFQFFNFQRDSTEIDLHGLLVADEKRLESLRVNLLIGSLNADEIKEILQQCEIESKAGQERKTLMKNFRRGKVSENVVKRKINLDEDEESSYDSEGSYSESMSDDYDSYDDDSGSRRENRLASSIKENRIVEVDNIIRKCRLESDEAIRKLKEKLDAFDHQEAIKKKTPWLEIIVGAGNNSTGNEQKIRPRVEKFLKERKLKFAAVNKGSLVVTFQTYSGPEPCFGEYYCEACDRCWKSSKSFVNKFQMCSSCKGKCWPVKQCEKRKEVNYSRVGKVALVKRRSKPHQSSLCQRCYELGRPCNEFESDSDF